MHVPIRILKRGLIDICKQIHSQPSLEGREIPIFYSVNEASGAVTTLRALVSIVRNAMNPNFFGANILFENYEYQGHEIEFLLVLPQVEHHVGIGNDNVMIESINPVRTGDMNEFIDGFRTVSQEWVY